MQALTYFCIYVVRQGVTSWFVFYLMKVSSVACPIKYLQQHNVNLSSGIACRMR